jgi:hypothetical protein
MQGRVGGKLMDGEANVERGVGAQHRVFAGHAGIAQGRRADTSQLGGDQRLQMRAAPIAFGHQILRAGKGMQPAAEAIEKLLDRGAVAGRLHGDRLHDGQ